MAVPSSSARMVCADGLPPVDWELEAMMGNEVMKVNCTKDQADKQTTDAVVTALSF